jgi:hypothetical protein
MQKLLTLAAVFLCSASYGAEKKVLSTSFPREVLSEILIAPRSLAPVPQIGDPYWQQAVPAGIRESYIKAGEQYLDKPWTVLPMSLFSEFVTNGNRTNYQNARSQRYAQLNSLVMAELYENRGRFMKDIIDGIWAVCEETWWGIPAHYNADKEPDKAWIKVSLPDVQTVDLFNAEAAGQLAWINYVLRPRFDEFSPLVSQRLEAEIKRRVIDSALAETEWWMSSAMNWNTWICSNWLTCVLFVEPDRETQLRSVEKILACLDYFLDGYPDDGGCDEGPGYWNHAAGSLYENLHLLGLATGGKIDLSKDRKIINMGSFIYKTYIGNGYGVNFADASPQVSPTFGVLYQFGKYVGDPVMMQYAAISAQRSGFTPQGGSRMRGASPNRDLMFTKYLNEFFEVEPREPTVFSSWLPDLQVITAHSKRGSNDGLYFAAKGGHNDESHNHNDVGSFLIYNDTKPVLVDVGSAPYTALTFVDATRYTLWPMQSGFHNCPKINGRDQQYGPQYAARNATSRISDRNVVFSVDVAGAYPPEAKVSSWVRNFNFARGRQLDVEERIQLTEFVEPSEIMLVTPYEVAVESDNLLRLTLGDDVRHVKFDARKLSARIEQVDMSEDPSMERRWGKLRRIRLTVMGNSLANTVKYTIY